RCGRGLGTYSCVRYGLLSFGTFLAIATRKLCSFGESGTSSPGLSTTGISTLTLKRTPQATVGPRMQQRGDRAARLSLVAVAGPSADREGNRGRGEVGRCARILFRQQRSGNVVPDAGRLAGITHSGASAEQEDS